jgi:phosphoribosyl 1,2-cyclic phosphodiesterase
MDQIDGLRLRFWGVRGSVPTPVRENLGYGGNTSCVEIRTGENEFIILDAGTGIRGLGAALLKTSGKQPLKLNLFLTHYHWDHIQGLPLFAPLFQPGNEITFHAAARLGSIRDQLRGQMKAPFFPVEFDNVGARTSFVEMDGGEIKVAGLRVRCFPMHHPQGAGGYRIEGPNGVIVFASDLEPGNPKLDRVAREFAEGADTLIYDSQYTPEEYSTHVGWGHSNWREAAAVARDARVKQLVLFHHDPTHDDERVDGIIESTRSLFENTSGAREVDLVEVAAP